MLTKLTQFTTSIYNTLTNKQAQHDRNEVQSIHFSSSPNSAACLIHVSDVANCYFISSTQLVTSIGRSRHCDIRINNPKISKIHAEIKQIQSIHNGEEIEWWLFDYHNATNGIFINSIRLAESLQLHNNDIIDLDNGYNVPAGTKIAQPNNPLKFQFRLKPAQQQNSNNIQIIECIDEIKYHSDREGKYNCSEDKAEEPQVKRVKLDNSDRNASLLLTATQDETQSYSDLNNNHDEGLTSNHQINQDDIATQPLALVEESNYAAPEEATQTFHCNENEDDSATQELSTADGSTQLL
jgi:pSer/pThr/pTyr-binding forkhead associated (FHA) protein